MDRFTTTLIVIGVIILVEIFLVIFGGVEKEDPYATHHSVKKSPKYKK
ncbi:hypothetical protein HYS97_02920 [Candidatus Daviesbacteria bacterium]|nr:hypothetical protein [Candidatus Daviesbacteria bacterium]